jgi:hypothetical protein
VALEGVDFSWGRPGAGALVDAGKRFVVRYVPLAGDTGKGLTAAELVAYRAAGLAVVLNFESSASRMRAPDVASARARGRIDALTSSAAANRLELPPATVVYFSADWDATEADQALIDGYLEGAAAVLGLERVGLYAGFYPIRRAQANRSASWFWQTYAWSGGRVAAGIHLYQYRNGQRINGASVDFDRAMTPDYGQWEAPLDLFSTPGRRTASLPAGTPHFDAPRGIQTGSIASSSARFDLVMQDSATSPEWVLIDGASGDPIRFPAGVACRWVKASALVDVRELADELEAPATAGAYNAALEAAGQAIAALPRR